MTGPASEPENTALVVRTLVAEGRLDEARERYAEVVARHQRRASRIALHYLRDAADADEAVQDAFIKAFTHIGSYKDEWPFEVWLTRILINGCLDRLKARRRRERWVVPMIDATNRDGDTREIADMAPAKGPSPEDTVLLNERRRRLSEALGRLPERQRTIFMLSHFEGRTSKEVSVMTGLNESTVRVHLFRAIRKLRSLLAPGAETETKARTKDQRSKIKDQRAKIKEDDARNANG